MKNANNVNNTKNGKRGDSRTAMGVAITLLAAGIIVQATDALGWFGHNSPIPLLIGCIVIVVGFIVVFVLHRMEVAKKGKNKEQSNS